MNASVQPVMQAFLVRDSQHVPLCMHTRIRLFVNAHPWEHALRDR